MAAFFLASFGSIEVAGLKISYILYIVMAGILIFINLPAKSWLYTFIIAVSFMLSVLMSESVERIYILFYHIFFIATVMCIFHNREKMSLRFIKDAARLVLLTLVFLTLFQALQNSPLLSYEIITFPSIDYFDTILPGAGFINSNNNAYYIFFAWILYTTTNNNSDKKKISFIDLLVAICILITASRYFTVFFFLAIFLEFLHPKNIKYLIFFIPLIFYGYFELYDFLLLNNQEFYFSKLETLQTLEFENTLDARFYYLQFFLSLDWLPFGLASDYDVWSAPHSFIFEAAFFYGITGLICVVAPCIYVLLYFLRESLNIFDLFTKLFYLTIIFFGWFIPSSVSISALHYLLCTLFFIYSKKSKNAL